VTLVHAPNRPQRHHLAVVTEEMRVLGTLTIRAYWDGVLAEARTACDVARIVELQGTMEARQTQTMASLPCLFDADNFAQIKLLLIELRYVHRCLEECAVALAED
jgi:hypothetical protein